jgi:Fic family protein
MWIWQSPSFPEFSFDANAVQAVLVAARTAQGRMLGVAGQLQLLEATELQLSGWAREALATAKIEGEVLQLNSVRASAARRLGLVPDPTAHKDERTEATLDVIQAAMKSWQKPLTHADLCGWQAALFPTGYSGVSRIEVGGYRSHPEPMQIVTQKLGHNDVVHYQAPDSKDVARQMTALLVWLNDGRISGKHVVTDGFIRAAIAHVWFEMIHPFEDGNGRIGRALVERCFAEDARSELRLFSLSQQFLLDRSGYYAQLQKASKPIDAITALDLTEWIQWFLGCIERACLESLSQMAQANAKNTFHYQLQTQHPDLSKSQRKVLFKLFEAQQTNATPENPSGFLGGMSTEKYAAISGVSRATAYRDLTQLVALQLLTISGQGRGTRYALASAISPSPSIHPSPSW